MPILEYGDWSSMQGEISAGNKAVSGLTPAEAEAAMKAGQINTNSGGLYVYGTQQAPPSGNIIQFPGTSAGQAATDYGSAGGLTNQTGAAIPNSPVVKGNNMALTYAAGTGGAAGVTGVAGLLSMNLPTAAAAIAPIAGVALGGALYYSNPDFWTKISRALLPFCYEDTELLPVVVDEEGTTYYPSDAIDAVKNVIEKEVSRTVSTSSLAEKLSPFPYGAAYSGSGQLVYNGGGTSDQFRASAPCVWYADSNYMAVGSMFPFTLAYSDGTIFDETTKNLGTASEPRYEIRYTLGGNRIASITGGIFFTKREVEWSAIIYNALYGASTIVPEGASSWTGPQYPLNPQGIGVITRIEDGNIITTNPYYPITTPVGDPGVSSSPLEVPDPPVTNPDPDPAINPWISPDPQPGTYPPGVKPSNPSKLPFEIPNYDPNLDPNADPSQEPDPSPEPEPDPEPADKPGNSGTTPIPIIPVIPTLPSAAAGLLHVYNPTQGQIDAFGSWLWSTFSGDLIDTISKLFNDPMDAVIGLHELYATPSVTGASTIRAGFLDSGVSSNVVGSRYTSINCGSIVVQEYYQNYLDYSPYTKCFLYLPFVGIVSVLADDIIGNAVNITYHIDSYTGCCIAIVTVARSGYSSTVYQFEGNCAVEIPITSGYQSTLMGAMLGIAGTALTGSPHVGLSAANLGRASLGKNDVSHSGSFGASYGAMGAKIPYIIVKRPTQKNVVDYNREYGFPAHKRVVIGNCSGYLRAREVHVISPTATDDEKTRIEELLKSGVFVK